MLDQSNARIPDFFVLDPRKADGAQR